MKKKLLILILVLSMLLPSCKGGVKAATMHLKRTVGRVSVSDDAGRNVEPQDDLGLYSGYGVDTRSESYAWVNLDEVKLTKMDQNTEIEIVKENKHLSIDIKSGSLFFNITEPLEDDETLDIRSSSMLVGIRGTCGWVEVPDADTMKVFLLEGKVRCEAGDETEIVRAGEMSTMTRRGKITVEKFTAQDIPDFVVEEIEEDDDLVKDILEDSGIDVLNPAGPEQLALEQYRAIIAQADTYFNEDEYYGDDLPTISYAYALVQMQQEHPVPALVLERETDSYWGGDISSAIVFQYDPNRAAVIRLEGQLSEGVASAGGYRGSLTMSGDGVGILETSWSSGTGDGAIVKVTAAGDSLRLDTLFDGFLFDESNPAMDQIGSLPIDWHDIADLSALDSWTPTAPAVQPNVEPTAEPTPEPTPKPTNVLADYVGTYTAYESFHGAYGGGERLRDVTLTESGMVTGGGTSWLPIDGNGLEPSSVTQKADGSIEIKFSSSNAVYTVYPAGVVPEGYTSDYWRGNLDLSRVHLRYFYFDGGVMDVLYHN